MVGEDPPTVRKILSFRVGIRTQVPYERFPLLNHFTNAAV